MELLSSVLEAVSLLRSEATDKAVIERLDKIEEALRALDRTTASRSPERIIPLIVKTLWEELKKEAKGEVSSTLEDILLASGLSAKLSIKLRVVDNSPRFLPMWPEKLLCPFEVPVIARNDTGIPLRVAVHMRSKQEAVVFPSPLAARSWTLDSLIEQWLDPSEEKEFRFPAIYRGPLFSPGLLFTKRLVLEYFAMTYFEDVRIQKKGPYRVEIPLIRRGRATLLN